MALEYAYGSFAFPTVTGAFSVTGIAFQPKLVRFWGNARTSDGSQDHNQSFFGAAVSSTSEFAIATDDENGVAASNNARRSSNVACILIIAGGDGLSTWSVADFTAFTSDGFTINVSTEVNVAHIVNYEVFGGTGFSAFIKEFTAPGSATSVGYTGVGFKPTGLALYTASDTTAPAPNTANHLIFGMGMASGTTARGAAHNTDVDAEADTTSSHGQTTSAALLVSNYSALEQKADLTSFDSDGFTLNWSTSSSAVYCWAICMRGGSYKVGEISQATATGNQGYTGVGFTPIGLQLLSVNDATDQDFAAHARLSYGAGTSSSVRGCIWFGAADNSANSVTDINLDRTKIINLITEGTPTVNAAADLVTLDADGFTLNWTTADATARKILYMAFGATDSVEAGGSTRSLALLGVGS